MPWLFFMKKCIFIYFLDDGVCFDQLALETILYVLLRDVTYYMHRIKRRGTQTIYR